MTRLALVAVSDGMVASGREREVDWQSVELTVVEEWILGRHSISLFLVMLVEDCNKLQRKGLNGKYTYANAGGVPLL